VERRRRVAKHDQIFLDIPDVERAGNDAEQAKDAQRSRQKREENGCRSEFNIA